MLVKAAILKLVWCLLATGSAQDPPPMGMRPVKQLTMPRRPGGAWPPATYSAPKVLPPCDSVTYHGQLCMATQCNIITIMVKGLVRYKATCSPVGNFGVVRMTPLSKVPRITPFTKVSRMTPVTKVSRMTPVTKVSRMSSVIKASRITPVSNIPRTTTSVAPRPTTPATTTIRTVIKPLRGGENMWRLTPPYVQYPSKPVARTRYRQSTKPDTSSTYLFKTTTKKAKTTDTSSTMLFTEATENKCGDQANCVYREEDVDQP